MYFCIALSTPLSHPKPIHPFSLSHRFQFCVFASVSVRLYSGIFLCPAAPGRLHVSSTGHEPNRAIAAPDRRPAPRHRGRLQPAIRSRYSETPERGTLIWDQHPELLPWNPKTRTLNLNIWGWNPDICLWDPKIWKLNPTILKHGPQYLDRGPQDLASKAPNLELNSELSG